MTIQDFIQLKSINMLILVLLISCTSNKNVKKSSNELNYYLNDYIEEYERYYDRKELKSIFINKDIDRDILTIMDVPMNVGTIQGDELSNNIGLYKNILCYYNDELLNESDVFKKVKRDNVDEKNKVSIDLNGKKVHLSNKYLNWTPVLEIHYDLSNKEKNIIKY